jgi:hypothetical protein
MENRSYLRSVFTRVECAFLSNVVQFSGLQQVRLPLRAKQNYEL